jgi:ribulose-5-phosphate 4-epimerase/fuculose-1-phosphate aldolase
MHDMANAERVVIGDLTPDHPNRKKISEEEWTVRCDLAALYRLVALEDYDDILLTHISARVPGPQRHFLINPFGLRFCEVTASSLVKIDIDGKVIEPTTHRFNYAGFVIHSAIHAAREDAHFIIHLHTDDGVAVSSQTEGVLPLNQRALGVVKRLAYHDYEGVATSLEERERLVEHLGDKSLLVLRNHGTLALGPTAGHAWMGIYNLEKTCSTQIKALSAGRAGVSMVPEEVQMNSASRISNSARRDENTALAWSAMMRRVRKDSPGFDI